ncbi:MAG: DUF1905 domain-containing protein [Micropepsaceae bacterium]
MTSETYTFKAKLWAWQGGNASWHFLTLPKKLSAEIRFFTALPKRGFGSVRVEARIGGSVWKTSLFPSKQQGSYILPVKAGVRQAELLAPGKAATVTLRVAI